MKPGALPKRLGGRPDVLECTKCSGSIVHLDKALVCQKCGAAFPVRGGKIFLTRHPLGLRSGVPLDRAALSGSGRCIVRRAVHLGRCVAGAWPSPDAYARTGTRDVPTAAAKSQLGIPEAARSRRLSRLQVAQMPLRAPA